MHEPDLYVPLRFTRQLDQLELLVKYIEGHDTMGHLQHWQGENGKIFRQ
jgi:hypothetical protein